jgi:hypothetical protein
LGALISILLVFGTGCASLASFSRIVHPPRFEEADDRPAEILLAGPSIDRPFGGARVRLWTRVSNPNSFGLRLSTLRTTLNIEGARAAAGDFPLGLPLDAGAETVVPLDLLIDLADIPGLSRAVRNAANGTPVDYELEGTIGIDAGPLGEPTFGPMTLLRGEFGRR